MCGRSIEQVPPSGIRLIRLRDKAHRCPGGVGSHLPGKILPHDRVPRRALAHDPRELCAPACRRCCAGGPSNHRSLSRAVPARPRRMPLQPRIRNTESRPLVTTEEIKHWPKILADAMISDLPIGSWIILCGNGPPLPQGAEVSRLGACHLSRNAARAAPVLRRAAVLVSARRLGAQSVCVQLC